MRAAYALAGITLFFISTVNAATVVFSSYRNEAYAAESARVAGEALGIETRLVAAVVDGTPYIRVLGPSGLSDQEARDLVSRAKPLGYPGAWFLAEKTPVPVATTESTPVMKTASRPVAAAQVIDPVQNTPRTEPAPASDQAASEPQPEPVARDELKGLLFTGTGANVGIIHVPAFSEGEFEFALDGDLSEAVWREVPGYDEMRVLEPDTLEVPRHRTTVRYFYTDKALYVGMYAEQPADTLIERLSARDDEFLRDGMTITLDTSGRGIFGYWFSVNLGGALADGKVAPERQYTKQWDGPWDAATARQENGWSAEMVLPWAMMAMPSTEGERRIGLFVDRMVGYLDERLGFPTLPPTGARFMSALHPMEFETVTPKRQLDFYPYVSGSYDAIDETVEGKVGVDIFWRPSTNLQMSATVNPDFGAVESDDVVVNLTATETFFPEKRLFFLEGTEIFATTPRSVAFSGGGRSAARRTTQLFFPEPTQVVNTRRIGGGADVSIPPGVIIPGFELSKPTELLGAAKGTGQVGGIRYGLMAAFEDDVQLTGTEDGEDIKVEADGRDFGVVRFLYQTTGEGRRSIGYIGTHVVNPTYDATVHGADAHFLSTNGKLQLDAQLLASEVDSVDGYGGMFDLSYTQRQGVLHNLSIDAFDDKLDINDLGFLRRNDNYGGSYSFNYTRSRGLKSLRSLRTSLLASYWENTEGLVTRVGAFWRNTFTFRNLFELRTELDYFPKRWDDLESEGNGAYRIDDRWVLDLAFGTDTSKALSFSGRVGARGEELGGWAYSTSLGATFKPNDRFSMDLDLNYRDRDGWLLHQLGNEFASYTAKDFQPRLGVEWFLSARQNFRLSMQWAAIKSEEQIRYELPEDGNGYLIPVIPDPGEDPRDFVINRMTVQFRYRWQIAPLSDLFVVYTRGSNVPSMIEDGFDDMFIDALRNPIIDSLIIKLRYRIGV